MICTPISERSSGCRAEAITKNYAESTIKRAAVEANEDGTKTYKVVFN